MSDEDQYNGDPYNNPAPFFIKMVATSLLMGIASAVLVLLLKLMGAMP